MGCLFTGIYVLRLVRLNNLLFYATYIFFNLSAMRNFGEWNFLIRHDYAVEMLYRWKLSNKNKLNVAIYLL